MTGSGQAYSGQQSAAKEGQLKPTPRTGLILERIWAATHIGHMHKPFTGTKCTITLFLIVQ